MNISHAYCISIHKSQGSEFDFVIMCVFNDYGFMLNKQLIYTGITRAKKSLILLGEPEAFMYGIQAQDFYVRKTTLQQRMLEQMQMFLKRSVTFHPGLLLSKKLMLLSYLGKE